MLRRAYGSVPHCNINLTDNLDISQLFEYFSVKLASDSDSKAKLAGVYFLGRAINENPAPNKVIRRLII